MISPDKLTIRCHYSLAFPIHPVPTMQMEEHCYAASAGVFCNFKKKESLKPLIYRFTVTLKLCFSLIVILVVFVDSTVRILVVDT